MFTKQHLNSTSDSCDGASVTSENLSESCSNLSSLSGLTGYEEELYSLRKLAKTSSEKINDRHVELLETETRQLRNEVHKLQEKYKADLSNAERRIELAFHERFEKLLWTNSQLEAELSLAKDQINFRNEGDDVTKIENENFGLNCKVNYLNSELVQCKNDLREKEGEKCRLSRVLEETKAEVVTKSSTVDALKAKIVNLHLELNGVQQENIRSNNALQMALNELNAFKKSENWYKEHVKEYRSQKSENLKEISRLHALVVSKEHELELRHSNLDSFKSAFEEFKLAASQEKASLLKTINQLQADSSQPPVCNPSFDDYDSMIESLNRELKSLTDIVAEQQGSFKRLNREHSEVVSRNTTLESLLQDKEILIQNLEAEKSDLNAKIDFMIQQLRDSQNLLMKTVGEKSELQVVLDGTIRDKEEIQEAVKTLRDKFSVLIGNYNKIKQELTVKQSEIEKFKNDFKTEENEKKLHEQCSKLHSCQQKLHEVESINLSLQNVNLELGSENRDYKQKLQEAAHRIKNLEKSCTIISEDLHKKEEQVHNLTQNSESLRESVAQFNSSMQALEEERLNLLQSNGSLKSEAASLETELMSLKSTVRSLQKLSVEKDIATHEYISLPKSSEHLDPLFSEKLNETKINLAVTDKIASIMSNLNGLSVNLKKQEGELEEACSIEEKVLKQFKVWQEQSYALKSKEDELEQMKIKLQDVFSQKEQLLSKLKEVKSLLKAKGLEMEEKRKRYEINNRTLLKKIKEHMRGRNAAEKRCTHLEELHNEAFDQLNSCKLRQSGQEEEIQNLRSILENYKNINIKLKQELLSMQKKLKGCDEDCDQLKAVKDRINQLLEELKAKEAKIRKVVDENSALHNQNSSLLTRAEVLTNELKLFTTSTNKLQEAYNQQVQLVEELGTKLLQEEANNSTQLQFYQQNLSQVEERNTFLTEEVQILNAELKQTKSGLIKFEDLKAKLESSWAQRENIMQLEIKNSQEELDSIKIDKNFLQRLCSDLKVTLKMALNQNKALKDQLKTPSQPVLNLPSPSHCNSERINELLQQLSGVPPEQPMSKLQYSLNSLKKEMASLRRQISEQCRL